MIIGWQKTLDICLNVCKNCNDFSCLDNDKPDICYKLQKELKKHLEL